jgi:hypothetical protein
MKAELDSRRLAVISQFNTVQAVATMRKRHPRVMALLLMVSLHTALLMVSLRTALPPHIAKDA